MMANSSYVDLYTRVYYILNEKTTSPTFPLDTLVKPMINEVQAEICRGVVHNEADKSILKAGDLRFLRKQMMVTIVPTSNLAVATVINGTTVELNDASNYATSGAISVLGIIINYTGKTGNVLTGCTGVSNVLPIGAAVRQVYKLPSTATYPFNLEYVQSTVTYNTFTNPYMNNFVVYRDFRAPKDLFYYFTIMGDNTTTDGYYLYINGYNGLTDRFILWYYEEATNMVADTDLTTIPDDRAIKTIPYIVAGRLLRATEEVGKATAILRAGYQALEAMYSFYSTSMKEFRQKVGSPSQIGYYQGIGSRKYVINYS